MPPDVIADAVTNHAERYLHPPLVEVRLETTTRCTAGCIYCPHGSIRRRDRDMTVRDILDYCVQAYTLGVRAVRLHFMGEATMHPAFSEYPFALRRVCPNLALTLFTNGTTLGTASIHRSILANFAECILSVDGGRDGVIRHHRPGVDAAVLERNAHLLVSERQGLLPTLATRMTVTPANAADVVLYRQRWAFFNTSSPPSIYPVGHWNGALPEFGSARRRSDVICHQPFQILQITVDGDACLCCHDWNAAFVVGNVRTTSIADIWHGDAFVAFRRLHIDGKYRDHPLCKDCGNCGYDMLGTGPKHAAYQPPEGRNAL